MLNKFTIPYFITIFFAFSCSEIDKKSEPKNIVKGNAKYGGVFSLNEVEEYKTLYPLSMTDAASTKIGNSIFQGLVTFSSDNLEILPCLAENWVLTNNGTLYTFKLRKNVFFHNDKCFPDGKGRELKAKDIKYCLDRLCEKSVLNSSSFLVLDRIKGATEYNNSVNDKTGGVSGIKVIDDYTISIELAYPFNSFLQLMALQIGWIYPKEAIEKYGDEIIKHPVGTGAFIIKNNKQGEILILQKNTNYWEFDKLGNKLPYLDAIKYTFVKEKSEEFAQFVNGNLDLEFGIPNEEVDSIKKLSAIDKENLPYLIQEIPSFTVEYFTFQHQSEIFDDVKVRKAFNHAVDKDFIVNNILRGLGVPLDHGIIPPTIAGYPYEKINGLLYDPKLAKQYLAEAGFPGGKNFPVLTLQLNYGGASNLQVAEALQKMLQDNLGVNIELTLLPITQHYERVENGKALFWRDGWVADYSDPENFLQLFYGKFVPENLSEASVYNTSRYKSALFDAVYEKALKETDVKKRMDYYREAAQIITDDAAVIPVFCKKSIRLLNKRVQNLPLNSMEIRDFSKVYFLEK
jgi:oligopeptide transport system substrate-binding protein